MLSLSESSPTSPEMTLLIAGFGYSAKTFWQTYLTQKGKLGSSDPLEQDLIEFWQQTKCRIIVTAQSIEKYQFLKEQGFDTYLFNETTCLPHHIWSNITHILQSIPPLRHANPTAKAIDMDLLWYHHADDLLNACHNHSLQWIGYLSTTGVYGNHQGSIVTENSATFATQQRAQKRKTCEQAYQTLSNTICQVQLFRLAGIYGAERNILSSLKQGTARRIDCGSQKFSRIHITDIARTIALSLQKSLLKTDLPSILNLCDDLPEAAEKVCAYAASLLNVSPPPLQLLADANLSAMARSFYADNRLMQNQRLRTFLGEELCYPTYQSGLTAIHQGQSD